MGLCQGVTTDHGLLRVSPGPAMSYPSTPMGHPGNDGTAILGLAHPQGVFYPFGHPITYAYGRGEMVREALAKHNK
jgi:hypothetical protein